MRPLALSAPERHPAAIVEDAVNALQVRVQRRMGWRPSVVGYTGYGLAPGVTSVHGDAGWVRVLGRVLLARPGAVDEGPTAAVRGWRHFLTSHVSGAAVTVVIGRARHQVTADRSGVIDAVLPVALHPGTHDVEFAPAGGRAGRGRVIVTGGVGDGLVSDIDDTVMVTWLPRPFLAAWNTFVLRETARYEVSGMSELYRRFTTAHPGAAVVYLSTGPWNAAPALGRFLHRHRFPAGPLLLTDWGPSNTGWFRSGADHKRAQLARLAAEMPGIRWLLVGDDGQRDPELYDEFARNSPTAVHAIALRRLSAAEQVLSRGTPAAPSDGVPATAEASVIPRVSAGDGHGLGDQLAALGLF